MEAKLLDFTEEAIHIEGVFAHKPAFKKEGVGCAGSVSHLSKPIESLLVGL
jgi:hypothetical protein